MPAVPPVDAARLVALLGDASLWGPVEVVASTGSTNADLMARLAAGAPQGLVRLAEHQDGGRARFDRVWVDVPGTAVAVSSLVRPSQPVEMWGWLSLLTGMAVVRGLRQACGADASRIGLKWPNDVLVDGAKICGILAEGDGLGAVLGWGLNVAMSRDELPVASATSLALAGLTTDKTVLVAAVLKALDDYYKLWDSGGDVKAAYLGVSSTIGHEVRVMQADGVAEGKAVGVDDTGALLVDLPQRGVTAFTAGDVVHLR